MENIFEFTLFSPAKNLGGDRYSTIMGNKEWTVYFPQEISRPFNRPVQKITLIVEIEGIKFESEDKDA